MTDTSTEVLPERTLVFPEDGAVGTVVLRAPGSKPLAPQRARGRIPVPPGHLASLTLEAGAADVGAILDALAPNDIQALILAACTDEGLRAAGRLTQLSMLVAQHCDATDDGLASLSELARLQVLVLGVAGITAAGVSTLARLPLLTRLTLVGPVPPEACAPLASSQVTALDLPLATSESVDAVRDLLPDLTINGVWLSSKARARARARTA